MSAETGRGRPRDAARDDAIHAATLELLAEIGYDRLTIEAVAGRAGVGKATIYRRYPHKSVLVAAAVDHGGAWSPAELPSGDRREVLLAVVGWVAAEIEGQRIGLLGALFAGMRSDPDLALAMRRVLERDQGALAAGPIAETLADPAVAGLVTEVATALVVHRVVIAGEPCDEAFVRHVVDDVLLPLLRS